MTPLTIISILLFVGLCILISENGKLEADKNLIKAQMDKMKEKMEVEKLMPTSLPLTLDDLEEAIRFAGFIPERRENTVRFMKAGETFNVDASRLPLVFVEKCYYVDPEEFEMDLLKQAAHLVSDEMVMVKIVFDEDGPRTTLNCFIATLDANYASFKENVNNYISIIEEGLSELKEIYDKLVEEKRDAALALNPTLPSAKAESKVIS